MGAGASSLLLVRNLDPENTVLSRTYSETVERVLGEPQPYEQQFQHYRANTRVVSTGQALGHLRRMVWR